MSMCPGRATWFTALAAALLALWPGRVWGEVGANAGVQRVAIVRLDVSGDVPGASRALLLSRLVEGLAMVRFQVLAGDTVTARLAGKSRALADCRNGTCYPALAEALQVGFLVIGRVDESEKSYDITLEMVNGRTGATIGRSHERCETCGITEAAEKLALATSALRARLETLAGTPARVVVRSRPEGALVFLDGKPIGTSPTEVEVAGGSHRLVLTRDRHQRLERTFTAVSGVDEIVEVELLRTPSEWPLRVLGFAGVIAGAALVGAGAYLASIDGQPVDCPPAQQDRLGQCPLVHDFDALSAVLVGVGAAALSLGGVSLWIASEQAPAVAGDGKRAFGLGWRGRF